MRRTSSVIAPSTLISVSTSATGACLEYLLKNGTLPVLYLCFCY